MPVDSVVWAALAFVLTAVGAGWTWLRWRREGLPGAVRGLAWTLLPIAALLTGTLRLGGDVVDAVGRWATRLVFDPLTWIGIIVAGMSVVLFGVSGVLQRRGIGARGKAVKRRGERRSDKRRDQRRDQEPRRIPAAERPAQPQVPSPSSLIDDDVAAILKKHGIR